MIKTVVIAAILILITVAHSIAEKKSSILQFQEGNRAYEAGNFQEAHDEYKAIVDAGYYAAPLFFNLGNAAYRLGHLGDAALWFRRALVLDPTYAEAKQNLRVVEAKTGFVSTAPNLQQKVLERFSRNQLVVLFCLGAWGAILSFLAGSVCRPSSWRTIKPWLFVVGGACLLLTAFCGFALAMQSARSSVENQAVVVSPSTVARTAPFEDADDVIALPPGTNLEVLSERGSWSFVGMGDSVRGWIRSNSLRPLWPYDIALLD